MKPVPTLEDVARLAGVSTATVSRVLNGSDAVRNSTRDSVQAAVTQLGYMPHFGGRALASNRTQTVGAVIPTMENAIFALGIQAMQDELASHGVTLLVATSHYDAVREAEQIRVLLSRGVDGLVLIGEDRPDEIYSFLEARGTPFVLVWSHRDACPHCCVGFDNIGAAQAMTGHVLSLGHRQVAMIAGITAQNDRARQRAQGVRQALAAYGLRLEPPYYVETPYSLDASASAAQRLMNSTNPPTAIVCGNDVLAAGAIIGARASGAAVPDDVSIVGFDDIELAVVTSPALTTVHVPHRRMGRAAANELLAMIDSENVGGGVKFSTEIVERESLTGPPQRA